jgi:hypothetical protein
MGEGDPVLQYIGAKPVDINSCTTRPILPIPGHLTFTRCIEKKQVQAAAVTAAALPVQGSVPNATVM